ncbi:MAG TPA: YjgP/YjgQ family permease [Firmicutes bacterium]|nr:YjgP/YjgQ family permease [Bacillota bacterium]
MDTILEMMDLLISKGVPFFVVGQIALFSLAWMLALAVPMAVLVSTLMAFGRLSADGEVLAMWAGGVSPYRMLLAPLVASATLTVGMVEFNDRVLPEANHRVKVLLAAVHRKRPALSLKGREGTFVDFPGYSLLFRKVKGEKLYGVTLYGRGKEGITTVLKAKWGELNISPDGETLTVTLHQGEVHRMDPKEPERYVRTNFSKYVLRISGLRMGLRLEEVGRGDREMSIWMLKEKIKELKAKAKKAESRISEIALKLGIRGETTEEILSRARAISRGKLGGMLAQLEVLKSYRRSINRYEVELHKKYSIPAACIVFVLVGMPLGIRVRRGGLGVGFGLSVGFFVLYWAFLIGGEELADRMLVSPWAMMWAPDLLIGALGIYLLLRMGAK